MRTDRPSGEFLSPSTAVWLVFTSLCPLLSTWISYVQVIRGWKRAKWFWFQVISRTSLCAKVQDLQTCPDEWLSESTLEDVNISCATEAEGVCTCCLCNYRQMMLYSCCNWQVLYVFSVNNTQFRNRRINASRIELTPVLQVKDSLTSAPETCLSSHTRCLFEHYAAMWETAKGSKEITANPARRHSATLKNRISPMRGHQPEYESVCGTTGTSQSWGWTWWVDLPIYSTASYYSPPIKTVSHLDDKEWRQRQQGRDTETAVPDLLSPVQVSKALVAMDTACKCNVQWCALLWTPMKPPPFISLDLFK